MSKKIESPIDEIFDKHPEYLHEIMNTVQTSFTKNELEFVKNCIVTTRNSFEKALKRVRNQERYEQYKWIISTALEFEDYINRVLNVELRK